MIELFLSAFITLFVVIDPPGCAPIYASLTTGANAAQRRSMAIRATIIAGGILIFFAMFGEALLSFLHIDLDSFRIAGGLMLFIIAIDMVFEKRTERREQRAEKVKATPEVEDVSVFPMAWAPLRQRPADILPLAERLLSSHAAKMRQPLPRLTSEARQCLLAYGWPGNVRELDNAIQRALILQQGGSIRPEDLCLDSLAGMATASPAGVLQAQQMPLPGSPVQPADGGGALGDDLRRREFELILETLRSERGRRKETADRLGISARTLRYKLALMRDAGMDIEAMLQGD